MLKFLVSTSTLLFILSIFFRQFFLQTNFKLYELLLQLRAPVSQVITFNLIILEGTLGLVLTVIVNGELLGTGVELSDHLFVQEGETVIIFSEFLVDLILASLVSFFHLHLPGF